MGARELSVLAYVILGLLTWRPASGYELKREADRSVGLAWTASYSHIYPELKRLADEGYVRGERVPGRDAPDKVVYALTERGQAALDRWVGTPAALPPVRDEALVKLFFANPADPEPALAQLDTLERQHAARLALYEGVGARAREEGWNRATAQFQFVVLDAMLEAERAWLRWIFQARADIEEFREDRPAAQTGARA